MATALDRIRAGTAEQHRRLEALPYAEAVLAGTVPVALYTSYLRALLIVHLELEQAITLSADPALRALLTHAPDRRALLERDLADLAVDPLQIDAAALEACVLAQQIRLAALQNPTLLYGHLYVLEGSQLGNLVQRAALEKLPALQHGGLSYLAGAGARARSIFAELLRGLAAALVDDVAIEAAVEGASTAFSGFERIMRALDPGLPIAVADFAELLNADAGTHSVPDDVREVDAALRAGEQSYRQTPYYLARYGERGLRFTRSDSCWLVTLARAGGLEQTMHQLHWLARMLASRGMPQLLLEQHLLFLHDALVARVPARAESYRTLCLAAEQLKNERLAALPSFESLLASFPALASEHGISAPQAGSLLLAAVADERRGAAQAVPSLTSWLCAVERFSPAWVAALQTLLAQARATV